MNTYYYYIIIVDTLKIERLTRKISRRSQQCEALNLNDN